MNISKIFDIAEDQSGDFIDFGIVVLPGWQLGVRAPVDDGFRIGMREMGARWDKENRVWRVSRWKKSKVIDLIGERWVTNLPVVVIKAN